MSPSLCFPVGLNKQDSFFLLVFVGQQATVLVDVSWEGREGHMADTTLPSFRFSYSNYKQITVCLIFCCLQFYSVKFNSFWALAHDILYISVPGLAWCDYSPGSKALHNVTTLDSFMFSSAQLYHLVRVILTAKLNLLTKQFVAI